MDRVVVFKTGSSHVIMKYSDRQPKDERGKFTDQDGASATDAADSATRQAETDGTRKSHEKAAAAHAKASRIHRWEGNAEKADAHKTMAFQHFAQANKI